MNSKSLISIILVVYMGAVTVLCYMLGLFFISHITMLLLGIIFGALVVRNEGSLEEWSRGKIAGDKSG